MCRLVTDPRAYRDLCAPLDRHAKEWRNVHADSRCRGIGVATSVDAELLDKLLDTFTKKLCMGDGWRQMEMNFANACRHPCE